MRTNKPSKDGLIGVHVSSMVNEVIRTISREFIFALRKNSPNAPKLKTNDFHPLKSFCARKIVAFVVFCLLNFVLLVGFGLICVFVCSKLLRKKIEIVLITSFTILLEGNIFCRCGRRMEQKRIFSRSSHADVFCKKTFLKYSVKHTGKHLCRGPSLACS